MTCPTCGTDHHAADVAELAADKAAAAEAYAEADAAREHEQTERHADELDTAETIAETQADAAVKIAEVEAAADVAIAEAEAAAAVDQTVVLADALDTDEGDTMGDEPDTTTDPPAGELADADAAAADDAQTVEIPPQVADGADSTGKPASTSTRRRTAFGRRRGR